MWGPAHFLYGCSPEHTVKPFMGAESLCPTAPVRLGPAQPLLLTEAQAKPAAEYLGKARQPSESHFSSHE